MHKEVRKRRTNFATNHNMLTKFNNRISQKHPHQSPSTPIITFDAKWTNQRYNSLQNIFSLSPRQWFIQCRKPNPTSHWKCRPQKFNTRKNSKHRRLTLTRIIQTKRMQSESTVITRWTELQFPHTPKNRGPSLFRSIPIGSTSTFCNLWLGARGFRFENQCAGYCDSKAASFLLVSIYRFCYGLLVGLTNV